mgnify:CR=1 FL=1
MPKDPTHREPMPKEPMHKHDSIDPDLVREIAKLVTETGLSEIEVEKGDLRIRVARSVAAAPVARVAAKRTGRVVMTGCSRNSTKAAAMQVTKTPRRAASQSPAAGSRIPATIRTPIAQAP